MSCTVRKCKRRKFSLTRGCPGAQDFGQGTRGGGRPWLRHTPLSFWLSTVVVNVVFRGTTAEDSLVSLCLTSRSLSIHHQDAHSLAGNFPDFLLLQSRVASLTDISGKIPELQRSSRESKQCARTRGSVCSDRCGACGARAQVEEEQGEAVRVEQLKRAHYLFFALMHAHTEAHTIYSLSLKTSAQRLLTFVRPPQPPPSNHPPSPTLSLPRSLLLAPRSSHSRCCSPEGNAAPHNKGVTLAASHITPRLIYP
ncbi:unnamed protein product [Pleuronectes platessa]|uniref:Uncharacterized protein n=1 Tax=Pleuronectes platessa TaxID=8262 RepID=A0A9N7TRG9_PLEPL|nr:unnamed protein product [Pleuronectes platessa]